MSEERKLHVWQWIVALLIGLPVLYVASFGPACWITSWTGRGAEAIPVVFRPMTWVFWEQNGTLRGLVIRYSQLASAPHWHWSKYLDSEADDWEFRWERVEGI